MIVQALALLVISTHPVLERPGMVSFVTGTPQLYVASGTWGLVDGRRVFELRCSSPSDIRVFSGVPGAETTAEGVRLRVPSQWGETVLEADFGKREVKLTATYEPSDELRTSSPMPLSPAVRNQRLVRFGIVVELGMGMAILVPGAPDETRQALKDDRSLRLARLPNLRDPNILEQMAFSSGRRGPLYDLLRLRKPDPDGLYPVGWSLSLL